MKILFLLFPVLVQARDIRAVDLDHEALREFGHGLRVEFRAGDEIPVSFGAHGDFFETPVEAVSRVRVKRGFWLELRDNNLLASVNGREFRPLNDLADGSFTVDAISAGALGLRLDAAAKP